MTAGDRIVNVTKDIRVSSIVGSETGSNIGAESGTGSDISTGVDSNVNNLTTVLSPTAGEEFMKIQWMELHLKIVTVVMLMSATISFIMFVNVKKVA